MTLARIPAVVFVAIALVGSSLPTDAGDRPNVLFVICDDLNTDLGCYGRDNANTPNIDRLAASGVRFKNATCQFPLCGPSRASFMTGLYPDQTGIKRNSIRIRETLPEVTSMSQHFRNNGYEAVRIGKIYHYNVPAAIGTPGHDDPASWDQTFNFRGRDKDEEDIINTLLPGRFGATLSWLAAEGSDEEQTDGMSATKAVELLEGYGESGQPFFLAVGFFRPHTPFVAPKHHFEDHPRDQVVVPQVPDAEYFESIPKPAVRWLNQFKEQKNLKPEVAQEIIQAYRASITFADAQVGRLLDALDRSGLAENTIVVFTSDHGYHMGEKGHYQKRTLFDRGSQVPYIVRAPGCQQGVSTEAPAEMVDFYPTLSELAGLDTPDFVSGVSQVAVLKAPQDSVRQAALTELYGGYSIRTPRYRYTSWGQDGEKGTELYDHESDAAEAVNLAGHPDYEQTEKRLAKLLAERVAAAKEMPPNLKRTPLKKKRRG
ncbi:sulfatase [Stratiformator vulcanicus]|uniref:Choline-sulfatase n=1 Tax=Stratiformator vulcanicus TaxID=2527980 RepID=A0A517R0I7_9PLAN|nr:sulfatase [Stratiformator vulcanicus]QDT37412.1 Choline-sulfatase [Stratiformator vulcanicus]